MLGCCCHLLSGMASATPQSCYLCRGALHKWQNSHNSAAVLASKKAQPAPDTSSLKFVFSLTCATWMGSCSPASRAMCALSSLRAAARGRARLRVGGASVVGQCIGGSWWVAMRQRSSGGYRPAMPAPLAVVLPNLLARHAAGPCCFCYLLKSAVGRTKCCRGPACGPSVFWGGRGVVGRRRRQALALVPRIDRRPSNGHALLHSWRQQHSCWGVA